MTNAKLLCPNCNCCILLPKVGSKFTQEGCYSLLGQVNSWWKLSDIYDFENIAVSNKSDYKYLACADCEMALGIVDNDSFLLSCNHFKSE